ncbi:chromatin-remodeling ATPase INO80-like [Dreissena polymorpha]|uniref:chromatin-remodeling ATPase INO80-like n=1 Tax=Dreissena polymorpha TaxID=45954 RepID=UPI00226444CB|nr:chromatin-remodeling ATPase INO80-like [Dreissena polymorpha]
MATDFHLDHDYGQLLANPPHIQRVEYALQLDPLLNYVEDLVHKNVALDAEIDSEILRPCKKDVEGNKLLNGITITKAERKADKNRLYNFGKVKKSRKWLKTILLSDSSSDSDSEAEITEEELHNMLRLHKYQRTNQMTFYQEPELHQFQYYSTGLLSNYDHYPDQLKAILGPKKKISKDQKKMERKIKAKLKKLKKEKILENGDDPEMSDDLDPVLLQAILSQKEHQRESGAGKGKKLTPEQAEARRRRLWVSIAKKEIPKAQKQKNAARKEMLQQLKKISMGAMREVRRAAIQSQKQMKDTPSKARRLTREMMVYWKRFEKVEKDHRKRVEKEALEKRKMDLEMTEAKRQQRKLNFLITQTELYAHFMARKITGEDDKAKDRILQKLEEPKEEKQRLSGYLVDTSVDDYDSIAAKERALKNANAAFEAHRAKTKHFDASTNANSLANATFVGEERPQPLMFEGKLKGYQLKGMNWLASLYDQGINGILADEMGLGKTVQSLSCLAHLAEQYGIWGPFLIVAPASTLHNWQQECSKFTPKFKVVPYWGNTQDRRVLRKFWDSKCLHTEEASFHVVITSYQLVIQDVRYFQRIKWQYMVLDEAQALKSSASVRWKLLLTFNCRNRLLLTGTPIQNSMAELWALLHFIMPTLFDSHDEFNEWFSKDIESHAEKQSGIDENQLSRLHMILKPFMLRRVKKDVENELSDKIEVLVYCPLTSRQRLLYQGIKNKISIEDLLNTAMSNSSSTAQSSANSLMNLVMQFRKVCNHPELFERQEIRSGFFQSLTNYVVPKLVYRAGLIGSRCDSRARLLFNTFYIHNPHHVHQSLFHQNSADCPVNSCFSFLRFINMSPAELHSHMLAGLLVRWLAVFHWYRTARVLHHRATWEIHQHGKKTVHLHNTSFLLEPQQTTYFTNVSTSPVLSSVVFTGQKTSVYTHQDHVIRYTPETEWHRHVRQKQRDLAFIAKKLQSKSPPSSPTKAVKSPGALELPPVQPHLHQGRQPKSLHCQPTEFPPFLYYAIPKVQARSRRQYVVDRSSAWDNIAAEMCGSQQAFVSLLYGEPEIYEEVRYWSRWRFFPTQPSGLFGCTPRYGYSGVYVPGKEKIITDAGKLYVLDTLLQRLKSEGHRVLIYSQMTKMIDLLEEYMWHRKHTYKRLDGSSKISERRDMVADFQARSDIFVFLLSTRAGGLGINLTAADTVIFYDSDWNPTVDQQAMDRAHRLGQTKQVTVYRLICKGTIEERILQRAKEKSEIQRMVISGGNFKPDTLKPKEVVSLLIEDDELSNKIKQRSRDKTDKAEQYKEKDRKRKRDQYVKKRDLKKVKVEENNVTIPAVVDTDSRLSFESSRPVSPTQSELSVGSETLGNVGLVIDESSNDALVIVDDAATSGSPLVTPKKTRGRGRPKGSGVGRGRPRGRGGTKRALSAAEIAGAQAGMTAAYAAYGYNYTGPTPSTGSRSSSISSVTDSNKAAGASTESNDITSR